MDYSIFLRELFIFCFGGLTFMFLFRKRIFGSNVSNNNEQKTIPKVYSLLSSTVDKSVYENALDAIELERQRIGSDIHDEMGSQLGSVLIDMEVIFDESAHLSEEASRVASGIRDKIKLMSQSLRSIVYEILPAALNGTNLTSAIETLCQRHDGRTETSIYFKGSAVETFALTDKQKLFIFRIVQELLTNCLKHAKAWSIFVSVLWSENELVIIVQDTGKGMPSFIEQENKFGIAGIFARAMTINAIATFIPQEKGTCFKLTLPKTV